MTCTRTTIRSLFPLLCFSFLPVACSSDEKKTEETPAPVDAEKWEMLVEESWTLPAGGEDPDWCKKVVLEEDIYVAAIRPVHPKGTHHTLLGLSDTAEGDMCTTSVATGLIYAAGVGSEGLTLPEGVAMKLPAGKVINLGLHLYNTSDSEISGTSGMEILRADPDTFEHEAESVLSGPFDIAIPPGGEHTLTHECPITAEQHVFALFPHMHQLGRHFKTSVTVGGVERVLHDAPYDFEEQYQLPVDVTLKPGDSVHTECTYENDTNQTVIFGESSDREMCFSVLFRYPKQGLSFCGGAGGVRPTLVGPPCAEVGDPGNEVGVGKHCTAGGGECGTGNMCLAAVTQGEFGNFCTTTCLDDTSCGAGASCVGESTKVCIPTGCALEIGQADGGAPAADAGG